MTPSRKTETVETLLSAIAVLAIALLVLLVAGIAHGSTPADAAAALPDQTLLLIEARSPAAHLEEISELDVWPAALETMSLIVDHYHSQAASLTDLLGRWRDDPEPARRLHQLAGLRLVAALEPGGSECRTAAVMAFEARDSRLQLDALEWWLQHFGRITVERRSTPGAVLIRARDAAGRILLDGVQRGGWLALGPPQQQAAVEALSAGRPISESLAELPSYRRLSAELPERMRLQGYLNTPRIADLLEACDHEHGRFAAAFLRLSDGIAVARDLGPRGIESRLAGSIPTEAPPELIGAVATLSPVESSLPPRLTGRALTSYRLGAEPVAVATACAAILERATPELHYLAARLLSGFSSSTGLDPERDLFPLLGRRLQAVVLPGRHRDWPLPRSVLVLETGEPESVRSFLESWFRWEAGALAPLTGGLVSAAVYRDRFHGVELVGLELQSLLELPMPSPGFALVDGRLLVSPVRSALSETVAAVIDGGLPADRDPPAVERLRLDLPGWGAQLRATATAFADRLPPPATELILSIAAVLESLGDADSITTMVDDRLWRLDVVIGVRKDDHEAQ